MILSFTTLVWIGFLLLIIGVVSLDLGVFHRKAHVVTLPEALGWSSAWIVLALLFNVGIYYLYELNPVGWDLDTEQLTGAEAALQFFTGYIVEKSLSIDNIFVIAMIFTHFAVPLSEQHRVLFWGIFAAVILRAVMIFVGIAFIQRFDWMAYVLGAVLLLSAASMLIMRHDTLSPKDNVVLRLVRRFYPVTPDFHGSRFFVDINGVRTATPLFLALVLVETSDVTFAIDSIPAIFAITQDPFIVFTSNTFAILGLRSLYFVLAGLMEKFRYMKSSLVFLLAFIGVKMIMTHHYTIPNEVSLAVISGILLVGIMASILANEDSAALQSPLAKDREQLTRVSSTQALRAVLLLLGSSTLAIGIAVLLLPFTWRVGVPGVCIVLALEFLWARNWLQSLRARSLAELGATPADRE